MTDRAWRRFADSIGVLLLLVFMGASTYLVVSLATHFTDLVQLYQILEQNRL